MINVVNCVATPQLLSAGYYFSRHCGRTTSSQVKIGMFNIYYDSFLLSQEPKCCINVLIETYRYVMGLMPSKLSGTSTALLKVQRIPLVIISESFLFKIFSYFNCLIKNS